MGETPLDGERPPLGMGGTFVADLPGQQSVGCPVLGTESEAELSETSLTGGDAVGNFNGQLPSQHLAFKNADTLSEANSTEANIETKCQLNPQVMNGELTALQSSSREQMARVRTCRRIPVILDRKDSDEGRTDPKETEMSDVMT